MNPQAGKCRCCGLWRGWGSPVLPCLGSSLLLCRTPALTLPLLYGGPLSYIPKPFFWFTAYIASGPPATHFPVTFCVEHLTPLPVQHCSCIWPCSLGPGASGPPRTATPISLPLSALDSRTPQLLELNVLMPLGMPPWPGMLLFPC